MRHRMPTSTVTNWSEDTLLDIRCAARECPDAVCVKCSGKNYTYREMAGLAEAACRSLPRPRPGRPFVLVAEQNVETLAQLYALLFSRVPALLISPKLTPGERDELIGRMNHISEPLSEGIAFVMFTSGTTGRSKPAMISRKALVASALAVGEYLQLTCRDVWQLSLSPARIGGLGIVVRSLVYRSALSLCGAYRAEQFASVLKEDGITIASVVPTMLADFFDHFPGWTPPGALRVLLVGGAHCSTKLRQRASKRKIPVVTTYAMTETTSTMAMSSFDDRYSPDAQSAVPLKGVQLRCNDAGVLWVRGPMLFSGYWGMPPFCAGDWFCTGDSARLSPRGAIATVHRQSDVITTGGEKVLPDEVEKAAESIPGVREARVLALPDEKWGAIVCAQLVAERKPIEAGILQKELAKRLALFKCPRRVVWVDALGRTREGKPNRDPAQLKGVPLIELHFSSLKKATAKVSAT